MRIRGHGVVALVAAVLLLAAAPGADAAGLKRVPGETGRSGPGTLFRYVVKVERGIRIDRDGFADDVRQILFDDRSWTGTRRVAFQQVRRRANTEIILARPRTVDRLCAPLQTNGMYSCNVGERVVLNLKRWRQGVSHWPSSRRNYRRMLVNHEVGHRIGHGHRNCPRSGRRAPVMQQQTIGLQGCRAGWWPTKRELRATRARYRSSASTSVGAASAVE